MNAAMTLGTVHLNKLWKQERLSMHLTCIFLACLSSSTHHYEPLLQLFLETVLAVYFKGRVTAHVTQPVFQVNAAVKLCKLMSLRIRRKASSQCLIAYVLDRRPR